MRTSRVLIVAGGAALALAVLFGAALASPLLSGAPLLAEDGARPPWADLALRGWLAWWPEVVMVTAPVLGTGLLRLRG